VLQTGIVVAGRYTVLRQLGGGGQGEVYAVYDQHEQDEVAFKLLVPVVAGRQWVEAAALRRLEDHHILPIRNADLVMGQPFLVTALARNGSIDARIAATSGVGLEIDDAVAWTRQACHGVGRGHAAGLVHNDVKPANLFLNDNDECVVADWGYAARIDGATNTAYAFGASAETVAPEVAAVWGTPTEAASVASDIYSLGATAFWMLAGQPPIDLTGLPDAPARMAAASAPTRPRLRDVAPHVSKWVCDQVDKAISPNPSDRYSKAVELAAALGDRPPVSRRWIRTNEHSPHIGCWRGVPTDSGAAMRVCAVPGTRRRVEISTTYQSSGRRYMPGCTSTTLANWPKIVRRLIARLT
jgi:serine/threonine-protein kinase